MRRALGAALLACACAACSPFGLSDDIALEGCETDRDCAGLGGEADGGACQAFVCGPASRCVPAEPMDADAAAYPPCDGGVSIAEP